jgi:hypothetical protein
MVRQPAKTRSKQRAGRVGETLTSPAREKRWRAPLWVAGLITAVSAAAWLGTKLWYSHPTPEAIWDRANQSFQAGRYDDAAAHLAHISRLRALSPVDLFLRAQLANARNDPDQAIADLERIPDDHRLAARARLLAGRIERRRDRLRLAEAAFLDTVRLDPSIIEARRELISIYGIQVRRPEINREFLALQKLIALTFDDVYHWTSLRNNFWEPGDVAEDLMRFVAADPLDRYSRLALAEIFRRMGRHAQAETTLEPLPPEDPAANAIRVQIALDHREIEKADRLLALGRADDAALARLRGAEALGRREAQKAADQFRIAYAANPDEHETLFGLWVALELLGNDSEAKPLREAARNLDLLNATLQRGRAPGARQNAALIRDFGTLCAALHRDAEARAWLQLAIAADPLDSEAQQALFRLNAPGDAQAPVVQQKR